MRTYGQIGYEAYRAAADQGCVVPGCPWEQLSPQIQAAWEKATADVVRCTLRSAAMDVQDYGRQVPAARFFAQRIAQGLFEAANA